MPPPRRSDGTAESAEVAETDLTTKNTKCTTDLRHETHDNGFSRSEFERREAAREARLEKTPLARMPMNYARQAAAWRHEHRAAIESHGDPVVRDAMAIVGWDAFLIGAKVRRALDGRDRRQNCEEGEDDDPVQNDWNGSAKVALIFFERSEAAWRVIALASGHDRASVLADTAAHLHRSILSEFPNALSFMRPGFDEPWIPRQP
jgi:hypothetical protein